MAGKTAKPKAHPSTWGRLSEELAGPKHLHHCQKCGRHKDEVEYLHAYIEHDENDRPEDIVVMICSDCNKDDYTPSGKRQRGIVARHERFYTQLPMNAPHPGILDLCVYCNYRDRGRGTHCAHPDKKANGGPGTLRIEFSASAPVHLLCSPRSLSGYYRSYGQATSCSGREEEDVVQDLLDYPPGKDRKGQDGETECLGL